jgi:glycosyltransferase involved in cell wall biosynthesis
MTAKHNKSMKKICYVATVPAAVNSFLRGHIEAAAEKWTVKISSHPKGSELLNGLAASFLPLPFERKIALRQDLRALWQLVKLFRRERFDLVHSIMPKTGLLSMFAAWISRVPYRVHTFTGQVWATKRGWKRTALKLFDRLIVLFATHILVDSPSQREFLIAERILSEHKGSVIGRGSICGVDEQKFRPDVSARHSIRKELKIGEEQTVILFLGRLNRDKGIFDLASAFASIAAHRPEVVLVLVGAEEDAPFERVLEICRSSIDQLRKVDFTPEPERYMAMADIFCLPSYREGFGQVIIEAAAAGIPTVASRIYGITDAIADGETGLLIPAGDVPALTKTLSLLVGDEAYRRQMGERARTRALALFSSRQITADLMKFYDKVFANV